MKQVITFPAPIFVGREGKWFIASCPLLDLATQGHGEEEARQNLKTLIEEYLADPDTTKPNLADTTFANFSFISVKLPLKSAYGKNRSFATA